MLKRILFVDDNFDILNIYTDFLSDYYEVTSCLSSEEAIEKMEERYDLLLSDFEIDERNGLELCELFKSKYDSKTILFSATYKTLEELPFVDSFAPKPIPLKTILGKIIKLIGV